MSFENSLVYKTNIGKYHQALILSQKMINDSFYNMWLMEEPKSPVKYFKKTFRGLGTFDAYLKAPYIKLQPVPGPSTPLLYYYLKIQSGTLKLYVSADQDDDTQKEWDMTDWSLCFPVNIGRREVKKGDPGFSETAQKMGLDENNIFSLAELLVEASTTTLIDIDKSDFRNTNWKNETQQAQINLNSFIIQWLQWAAANKTDIIGIAAQVQPGNAIPSTFPPTTLDRTAYPWKDPSNPSAQATNDNDRNALTYLMMTGFTEAPIPPGIEYSGTFTEDGGAFCMNATVFWDKWLLPLFQNINKGTEMVATTPYLESYNGPDKAWAFTAGPGWTVGYNSAHSSSSDSYFAFESGPTMTNGRSWRGTEIKTSKYCRNYDRGADETINESSTSWSNVKAAVGGQRIDLTGGNTFVYQVTFNWDGQSKRTSTATFTTNWKMAFAVGAVNDGGLQISYVDPGTDAVKVGVSVQDGGFGWSSGSFANVASGIESNIKSSITSVVSNVQGDMIHRLENQQKLFLPAGGVFLMRDAMFNLRGDLLTSLTYNGADGPNYTQASVVAKSALAQSLPARGNTTTFLDSLMAKTASVTSRLVQKAEEQLGQENPYAMLHGVPAEA